MLDSCDRVGDNLGDGEAAESSDDVVRPSLITGTCHALRAVPPAVAGLYPSMNALSPSFLMIFSLTLLFTFLFRLLIE